MIYMHIFKVSFTYKYDVSQSCLRSFSWLRILLGLLFIVLFELPPEFIIHAGFVSCNFLDESFQAAPVVNFFKYRIHPSIDDTVGRVEIPCVMNMVFFVTDNKTCFLKEPNNWMWFGVNHMSPFVTFVGYDSEGNSKYNHPVYCLRSKWTTGCHNAGY